MKIHTQISAVVFAVIVPILCFLQPSSFITLTAQETSHESYSVSATDTATPTARNAWEEIYFHIANSFSPNSLLELLKSMEMEEDQAGLASSYAVILKDQIYTYREHYAVAPIDTETIVNLLLDKVGEQAQTVMRENPEIVNLIGLSLVPSVDYNVVMGKAVSVLGLLGATDFSESIVKLLDDINTIAGTGEKRIDDLAINYVAASCLEALIEFQNPSAYAVLFQVKHGSFPLIIRNRAAFLMEQLEKQHATEVTKNFMKFVTSSPNLYHLYLVTEGLSEGEFSFAPDVTRNFRLTLLSRMNEATWAISPIDAGNDNMKDRILRKTINDIFAQNGEGLENEFSEQFIQSYMDSDSMDIKLLTLQAIGKFKTEQGIDFLQEQIIRFNTLQRSGSPSFTDQRILRQLLYSLSISRDSSDRTVALLRDVSMTPHNSIIRKMAVDMLQRIS